MSITHLRCEACHQWHISGDNHAIACVAAATALEGETLCDRCGESSPAATLSVGFCQPCVDAIERVYRGDFRGYGF